MGLRPQEYAPVLAKWFEVNITSFKQGLGEVKVRDPARNIIQESWDSIRKWDKQHNGSGGNGNTLERVVYDVMKLWEVDTNSIWNNDCVLVSPENQGFIDEG